MPLDLVFAVQLKMLFAKAQRHDSGSQGTMLFPCAPLAAFWLELIDRDADRYTGVTVFAMWPVGKTAAAPKAKLNQPTIGMRINQVVRRGDQGLRHHAIKITAHIWCGRIKLQFLQRWIGW